ncbi:actin [Symbiodinium microadriaticum]|uniref:Actin n=1 Tax=Symbiodinium microadriaticum TaxID=2951 RepID=A0A1Q9CXU0_SYMMI|nr:actin [Symbiodinium microadriaticum]
MSGASDRAGLSCKLSMSYPMENGEIENFDDIEKLWTYIFEEKLKEPPYNPTGKREKMVEVMFETFGVPSLNISIQGVLALLGQGRTTGLVLDSGEGVTHCVPIFDGYGLPHCINRLDLAGRDLNTLLCKLIALEGKARLTTTEQHAAARQMKEELCYVALDPSTEVAEFADFRLPGGRTVQLQDERWRCPEALFNPSLVGLECFGVSGMVWDSISRCELDVRKNLLSNVVLSGGCTMFPGFSERLSKELRALAPVAAQCDIRVLKSRDQISAVWTGGQVFASLREMQEELWMSIDDYDEYGASLMHEKVAVKFN